MSEVKKDLNYYMEHVDEMPTDPKEIEQLANAHMQQALETGAEELTVDRFVQMDEKPESSTGEAKVEVPKDEPKAEEPKAEEPKAEAPKDEKPEGILARDGKNVIPYSQLESARERAKAAETLVEELNAKIEQMAKDTAKPAATDTPMLTEDELTALEADSPTLAKVLRATQNKALELEEKVKSLETHQQATVAREVDATKSEIQTAIDATPELAKWQADKDDPSMWNLAASLDATLRERPEYKGVPFADRFKKVVELTKAALGQEAPKTETPKPTQEELKAAAAAKLKAKPGLPSTLSDIPGGAPPAVDEKERVEQMSPVELGNKFMAMTPDQMEKYLSQL